VDQELDEWLAIHAAFTGQQEAGPLKTPDSAMYLGDAQFQATGQILIARPRHLG